MKLRIMGTTDEVAAVIVAVRGLPDVEVLEVSSAMPNRGDSRLVRVYVEARLLPTAGGVPVTDAVVEAAAAEAEAGYDPDRLRRLRRRRDRDGGRQR